MAEPQIIDAATLQVEIESYKRQLKAAQTRTQNLRGEIRHISAWHEQEMAKAGGMSFATQTKIDKVLHPDSRKQATEADKDEAYKLLNAWKADRNKAASESDIDTTLSNSRSTQVDTPLLNSRRAGAQENSPLRVSRVLA
jgi:hypothetical protein